MSSRFTPRLRGPCVLSRVFEPQFGITECGTCVRPYSAAHGIRELRRPKTSALLGIADPIVKRLLVRLSCENKMRSELSESDELVLLLTVPV